jgi:hypothetical protein
VATLVDFSRQAGNLLAQPTSDHESTPRQETQLRHWITKPGYASRTTYREGRYSQASPLSKPPTNSSDGENLDSAFTITVGAH